MSIFMIHEVYEIQLLHLLFNRQSHKRTFHNFLEISRDLTLLTQSTSFKKHNTILRLCPVAVNRQIARWSSQSRYSLIFYASPSHRYLGIIKQHRKQETNLHPKSTSHFKSFPSQNMPIILEKSITHQNIRINKKLKKHNSFIQVVAESILDRNKQMTKRKGC
jgi:hypothetical protein